MRSAKMTIIGCGLVGGSVALAIQTRRPDLKLACLDLPDRLPAIREAGVAAEVGTLDDMAQHLPESALVLLAAPVLANLELLARIAPHLEPGAIVTDVSSTKAQIMARAQETLPAEVHFIGGHPIAGSERSGVEAADPLLFSGRVYALCPLAHTPAGALLSLIDLAEDILAVPLTIDAEEHDRIMAMLSHLPQVVAVALMHAALEADGTHGMLDVLAGRAFLDLTRIAASDFQMWKGILATNSEAISDSLDRFEASLSMLRNALAAGENPALWERASLRRRKMGLDSLPRMRKHDLRSLIDRYDNQLLSALANRMRTARRIGQLKTSRGSPVHDPARERRMMEPRAEWARSLGLPQDLVDELFAVIVRHSTRIQMPPD